MTELLVCIHLTWMGLCNSIIQEDYRTPEQCQIALKDIRENVKDVAWSYCRFPTPKDKK